VYFTRKGAQETKRASERQQRERFQSLRQELYLNLIPAVWRAVEDLKDLAVESQDREPILEQLRVISRHGELLSATEKSLTYELLQEWGSRMKDIQSIGSRRDRISWVSWKGDADKLRAADEEFVEKLLEAKRYIANQVIGTR
jgi:hypothetical protein